MCLSVWLHRSIPRLFLILALPPPTHTHTLSLSVRALTRASVSMPSTFARSSIFCHADTSSRKYSRNKSLDALLTLSCNSAQTRISQGNMSQGYDIGSVSHTHKHKQKHTHKQTDTHTQTNIHTNKQTHTHTHKQTDTHKHTHTPQHAPKAALQEGAGCTRVGVAVKFPLGSVNPQVRLTRVQAETLCVGLAKAANAVVRLAERKVVLPQRNVILWCWVANATAGRGKRAKHSHEHDSHVLCLVARQRENVKGEPAITEAQQWRGKRARKADRP